MSVSSLTQALRNRLPIKMVIVNNGCHGMVRQFQETYFDGRYTGTYDGYSAPDFARVAEAYGVRALTVSRPEDVADALDRAWADPGEPFLLQAAIDGLANVYPKLAFGRPIHEMEPFATPLGMEAT